MQLVKLTLDGKISYAGSSSLRSPKLCIGLSIQYVFKRRTEHACYLL